MLLYYVFNLSILALNHSLFFFTTFFIFYLLKNFFSNLNLFILIGGEP